MGQQIPVGQSVTGPTPVGAGVQGNHFGTTLAPGTSLLGRIPS